MNKNTSIEEKKAEVFEKLHSASKKNNSKIKGIVSTDKESLITFEKKYDSQKAEEDYKLLFKQSQSDNFEERIVNLITNSIQKHNGDLLKACIQCYFEGYTYGLQDFYDVNLLREVEKLNSK